MKRHIALLRGINISGKNKVPMAELKKGFEAAGFLEVKTWLNSGTVVFSCEEADAAALADRIETIFRVAAANGAETLIMGAFGCGRNGYPVEQVIELIQNWIAEHPGAVPNVVFAVPRMHADAFREAFGAPEPERPAPVVVAEGENDREGDDEDWRNVELPEGVTLR